MFERGYGRGFTVSEPYLHAGLDNLLVPADGRVVLVNESGGIVPGRRHAFFYRFYENLRWVVVPAFISNLLVVRPLGDLIRVIKGVDAGAGRVPCRSRDDGNIRFRVARLGGDLRPVSKPGQGTDYRIRLSVREPAK